MNDTYKMNSFDELQFSMNVHMDIEFYLRNVRYNISWKDHKPFICVCPDGDAEFFKDADDLLSNYKVDGVPLKELWSDMDIISM